MASINKYCNLYGANKIKDEYEKINAGFLTVENDFNTLDIISYKGVWDANTNTPTLTGTDLTKAANMYIVTVSGTQFAIDFVAGDWAIYNALGELQRVPDGNFEVLANKVISLSGSSTDAEYPTAKLVYDQLALKQSTSAKNANNGYCGLDSGGKVAAAQLPSTILVYKEVWNATTNTPTLATPTLGNAGFVYIVNVAGTQFGIDFGIGDWLIFNGAGVIQKSDNTDAVVSVNGQTGVVVLNADNIDDSATTHKFVAASDLTNLGNLSGTNSGNETTTTIGTLINGATTKATPVDADIVGYVDTEATNVIKKFTFANLKAFLKTYFDTLYNKYVHPNHTGDVTSVADGATTIAAKAVTLAKMADMATASLIYRTTAGTGAPEVNSLATLKTDLGIETASYLTDTTVTQQVTSIPSTAFESKLKTAVISGNTVNTLGGIVGQCEDVGNWDALAASTIALSTTEPAFGTNSIEATATANTGVFGTLSKTGKFPIVATKYYFVSGFTRMTGAVNSRLKVVKDTDGTTVIQQAATQTNIVFNRQGVILQPSDLTGETGIRIGVEGTTDTIGDKIALDAIMLIEITSTEYALGVAALLIKYQYTKQLANTGYTRVKSVGKNLFNVRIAVGTLSTSTGAVASSTTSTRSVNFIRIASSTAYVLSNSAGYTDIRVNFYDRNFTFTGNADVASALTFTTPANAMFCKFRLLGLSLTNNIQIEKGSTPTTFESYKESIVYTPLIGGSVGTVKDYFDLNTGIKYTNNSFNNLISSTVYASLDKTTYTTVDVVKTTAFALAKVGTTGVDGVTIYRDVTGKVLTEVTQANIDLVASIGSYYYHTDNTVWILITPDTYVDIAAARTGLGTSSLDYQLLTQSQLRTENINGLIAFQNGTIFIENVVKDTVVYTDRITVPDSNYPFRSTTATTQFDKFQKITVNGDNSISFSNIAQANVTINSGLLYLTISDAVAGDIYYYERYLDSGLSTVPDFTYSYSVNRAAQGDQNTESITEINTDLSSLEEFTVSQFLANAMSPPTEIGGRCIPLINKTGVATVKGTIVDADTGTDFAFKVAVANSDVPIGIVYNSGVADGGTCWVVIQGIADVLMKDTVASTRGGILYVSATAGRADWSATIPAAATHDREIGHNIQSTAGGTDVLVRAVLHFR